MRKLIGYIGTYQSAVSFGIYQFELDIITGVLSAPKLFCKTSNAKYLTFKDPYLIAPISCGDVSGLCLMNVYKPENPIAAQLFGETCAACYVTQSGEYIYTANYHEGTVLVYQFANNTLRLDHRLHIAEKAGCHQVLLHDGLLFVPCLELDAIHLYDLKNYAPIGKIPFPLGSGPRHGVFEDSRNRFYVLGERDHTLYALDSKPPFTLRETLPLLTVCQSVGAESAALRLSSDERFLYVSTRGANLLNVVALEADSMRLTQQIPCGGDHPRDILLTPDERFLLVVNRYSGNLCSFERDRTCGLIRSLHSEIPIPEGVAIVLNESQNIKQAKNMSS